MLNSCCAHETKGAPFLKTVTFAILHFSIAFTVAYLLTGSVITGGLMRRARCYL